MRRGREAPGDPRVFFAAERTLLAWVRSGVTLMALGFVVARFSLFLEVVAASRGAALQRPGLHWLSTTLGLALVVLGTAGIFAALYNHRRYVRLLPAQDVPAVPLPGLATFLCVAVALTGVVLAAYLALTAAP